MTSKLIAEEGLLKGLTLALEEGQEVVIGRDPEVCQLVVEDPTASREHLKCHETAEGIIVENLSESNPSTVNEQALAKPYLLHHGDLVKIGDSLFRFYTQTQPEVDLSEVDTDPEEETEESHESIFEDQLSDGDIESLAEIDLDLSDTMPWMLKVVGGPNNGAQFSMQRETSYVVGTDPATCDVVFHDASVSRQHARIAIGADDTITIEDLHSSNGTVIQGVAIEEPHTAPANTLITMGTTAFVIINQEGEQQTLISPMMPAIASMLHKEEEAAHEVIETEETIEEDTPTELPEPKIENETGQMGSLIFVAILTGLFLIVGIGTYELFKSEKIVEPIYNIQQELEQILTPYPSVTSNFNKTTGRLTLVGHVLTGIDRDQLIHNLRALGFIDSINNNVVVDENIWNETNQVLAKNPNWKGVTVHSPKAGNFVITGYLKTSSQMDALSDYLSLNFPYLDLLTRRVIVEEDILNRINVLLRESGFNSVDVKISSGDITLSGDIPFGDREILDKLETNVKKIDGVRTVKRFINELPPAQTLVNISEDYTIDGSVARGDGAITVIINGQVYGQGDTLDGKLITEINSNRVILESGGIRYRIDYN